MASPENVVHAELWCGWLRMHAERVVKRNHVCVRVCTRVVSVSSWTRFEIALKVYALRTAPTFRFVSFFDSRVLTARAS